MNTDQIRDLVDPFECQIQIFPLKYLGLTMYISKLAVFIQVPYEHGKSKGFSFFFRECTEHQKNHLVN